MRKWICRDGHSQDVEIEAATARQAAVNYVDTGDWPSTGEAMQFSIYVMPVDAQGNALEDEGETISVVRTFPKTYDD